MLASTSRHRVEASKRRDRARSARRKSASGSADGPAGSGRTRRLSKEQIKDALKRRVEDVIGPELTVLFCGINPGLYTAATGHHFAGPGNRFWPTMHAAGFTPRRFTPSEDGELLELGLGITNLVDRPTASADLLAEQELRDGGRRLVRKVKKLGPRVLAFVGLGAYRTAFGDRKAACGLQAQRIGSTRVWLLPNPSGLNAHHQGPVLVELFRELRLFVAGLKTAAEGQSDLVAAMKDGVQAVAASGRCKSP